MVVAMACTENWYHYLAVDIYSLLKTTPAVKKIYLLLETDNIDDIPELKKVIEKYPVEIKIVNFNNMIDDLIEKENINKNMRFSNYTFARLALPSIVEEDKVLYIDTDAIVLKDVSDLWDIDIDDYYLAGCKDYGCIITDLYNKLKFTGKYLNAGVILMNLKKIRENNIQQKCFEIINKKQLEYPDQDALNMVCQHNELYISCIYNYIGGITGKLLSYEKIKIIHYAGEKKDWIKNINNSFLWYDIEEKFYDEFE